MNLPEVFQQVLAAIVLLGVFLTLQMRRNAPTEILFCMALAVFVLFGLIEPELAWQGFADPAVIAIAGLLVISAALRSSGVLDWVGRRLLGNVQSERGVLARLSLVLVSASAFLLNTALVAMLMPMVINWCRQRNLAPSRLLLPISYLAIMGGTCTLVGTSTNFVVDGELRKIHQTVLQSQTSTRATTEQNDAPSAAVDSAAGSGITADGPITRYPNGWLEKHVNDLRPMSLTDISWVGVPCAVFGSIFLLFMGSRLLPDRSELLESLEEQRREYIVEMMVLPNCALVGKTVEEGGLRHLPGLFLIEIDRAGQIIGPVTRNDVIEANDRLVFAGVVSTIVDLERIQGLAPAANLEYEISDETPTQRTLVEVVLSPSSPLVGTTIRDANFRQLYGAAVVAVHRNGERLPTKLGDIELSAGDTLLLQTGKDFVRTFRNRRDFYLVSTVMESEDRRYDKMYLACAITVGLVLWLFLMPLFKYLEWPDPLTSPPVAILVAAMGMIGLRCLSVADARQSFDWPMLLTVGAAIGVGRAVKECGAAGTVADTLVAWLGTNPMLALILCFAITVCFTEMLSNVAVAAMMFHIALGMASALDVNPRPFIMAVALAASLSFVSPIGYQTNLMVMGPGGYRPSDYVRAGLPLSLSLGVLALIIIPLVWPF